MQKNLGRKSKTPTPILTPTPPPISTPTTISSATSFAESTSSSAGNISPVVSSFGVDFVDNLIEEEDATSSSSAATITRNPSLIMPNEEQQQHKSNLAATAAATIILPGAVIANTPSGAAAAAASSNSNEKGFARRVYPRPSAGSGEDHTRSVRSKGKQRYLFCEQQPSPVHQAWEHQSPVRGPSYRHTDSLPTDPTWQPDLRGVEGTLERRDIVIRFLLSGLHPLAPPGRTVGDSASLAAFNSNFQI
ncbi:hypothetical protein ACLKA7_005573 [Drosophila subpalustris]